MGTREPSLYVAHQVRDSEKVLLVPYYGPDRLPVTPRSVFDDNLRSPRTGAAPTVQPQGDKSGVDRRYSAHHVRALMKDAPRFLERGPFVAGHSMRRRALHVLQDRVPDVGRPDLDGREQEHAQCEPDDDVTQTPDAGTCGTATRHEVPPSPSGPPGTRRGL